MLTDRDAVDYSLTFSFPSEETKSIQNYYTSQRRSWHQMKSNPVLQKQLDSHFNVKAEISEVPLYHWLSYPLWYSTAMFPGTLFIIRKHRTGWTHRTCFIVRNLSVREETHSNLRKTWIKWFWIKSLFWHISKKCWAWNCKWTWNQRKQSHSHEYM